MGMQQSTNPASRNPAKAAGDAKPGIVPAPKGPLTLGKAPEPGTAGHTPGGKVTGFSGGGEIAGKVKV